MPVHRTKENQGIVATESRHTVEGMARGRKKRKSPPRKKPPTKKEKPLLAAPLAYGRLRRPQPSHAYFGLLWPLVASLSPPSLLMGGSAAPHPSSRPSSFGGCAASFSCPLRASLSSCGRLRRPSSLLLLSRFFRAAAPPYPFRFSSSSPRFFGGCAASYYPSLSWAAGAAPSLPFPVYFNIMARGLQVINFFSFAITITSLIPLR